MKYITTLLIFLFISNFAQAKNKPFAFDPIPIEEITIYPTLDLRSDQAKRLKMDKWGHGMLKILIKRKGYKIQTVKDRSLVENLQNAKSLPILANMIEQNPSNKPWVMYFLLLDSESKMSLGSSGNAEVVVFLVDTVRHKIVWRFETVGKGGQGGLVGMAMKGMMQRIAVESAIGDVAREIPSRKKALKLRKKSKQS